MALYLPAFAMTTALIVLFAGALGDRSWPDLSDKALTHRWTGPAPAPPARTAGPPAAPTLRSRCGRRGTAGGARRPAAPDCRPTAASRRNSAAERATAARRGAKLA